MKTAELCAEAAEAYAAVGQAFVLGIIVGALLVLAGVGIRALMPAEKGE